MTRRLLFRACVCFTVILTSLAPMVQGAAITQRAGDDYVAFEAEDYTSMGGTRWRVIDLVTPYVHPDSNGLTSLLLPSDTNASGDAALLIDFAESAPSGTGIIVYEIEFTTPGVYYYYTRDGAFENGDVLDDYGNEDSHYIPTDFDTDPTITYGGYSGSTEGQYGWRNGGASRTFTVATAGTYEFRIKNREPGFSLDRIVFSTATSLNASVLDELYNYDVALTYATADGDWATAANWDHGAPAADSPTFIGNGRSITLNAAGARARTLSIGYDDDLLPGSGTLTQTGGDLTVGESLKIGFLENGPDSITGNYTVTGGGSLQVGLSTTERADLYVGKHTLSSTDLVATGTLDLSGAAQFTAYLANFEIGNRTSGEGDGKAQGIVNLAADNMIDATSILISRSSMYNTVPLSELRLGANNLIKTDTLMVGGLRGNAKVSFLSGGTLTLEGSSGAEADLFISSNVGGTGSAAKGVMDLSGGTFNATLDEVVIGYDDGKGAGVSDGTLTFDAGTVTANSLVLGDALTNSAGDGPANGKLNMNGGTFTVAGPVTLGTGTDDAYGTITLTGGTFSAESITKGIGTANFNWTGGTLHVETFGFDLVQNNTDGLSVLAPGRSLDMTTIQGNYDLLGGQIEIELNDPVDQGDQNPDDEIGYDFVHVEGDALLNGQLNILLADGYEPELRDSFDVLKVDGEWSGTLLDDPYGNLIGDPLGAYAWWDVQLLDLPDGSHVLRLTAVPEPSSLLLAVLGLLVAGCVTRRQPYGCHRAARS